MNKKNCICTFFFFNYFYIISYILCVIVYVKIYDQHGAGHLNFDIRSWSLVGRSIVVQV